MIEVRALPGKVNDPALHAAVTILESISTAMLR
jgi:hypothetical protein